MFVDRLSDETISLVPSNMTDCGFDVSWGQTKTIKLVFTASDASVSTKTRLAQNQCASGATCLPVNYCFSDLSLLKSNSECWSSKN